MSVHKKILRGLLIVAVPLFLGVVFSVYINQSDHIPEDIAATVLPDARSLPDFVLRDHRGQIFSKENLRGQWSFIFFGYTHCPDICPTTLDFLNQVHRDLQDGAEVDVPQVVFVSVDPERDHGDLLATYVSYFNDTFIGVTGREQDLKVLTSVLGVAFSINGNADSDNYHVDHSARVMLIDPQARFKAVLALPHDVARTVYDYSKIVSL